MNAKIVLPMLLASMVVSVACTQHHTFYEDVMGTSAQYRTGAEAQIDAKIMGAMVVLDKNEIAAGSLAQHKSTNMSVKRYADLMVNAHGQNLHELEQLGHKMGVAPEHGSTAALLQAKGKRLMTTLHHTTGHAFDKAYIGAMVQGHAEALQLVDKKLLSDATNPRLRHYLEMSRAHIADHLQKAKEVQRALKM